MRLKRILKTLDQPPGTPVFTAETTGETTYSVMNYDADSCTYRDNLTIDQVLEEANPDNITWIGIRNLNDGEALSRICGRFGFHPMTGESLASTLQRPRIEDYGSYLLLTLRHCGYNPISREIIEQQISIIITETLLITVTTGENDLTGSIRNRLEAGRGRIRSMGTDYLAYSIMDSLADHFFVTLDGMNDILEELEDRATDNPDPAIPGEINRLKTQLYSVRKAVMPLREITSSVYREELPFFHEETRIFARDLFHHILLAGETLEMYRERLSGITDIHNAALGNRMNRVMQVLTLIATIFIPLTFLAGVYGMNFKHMPELDKPWAYPLFWIVIAGMAAGMVYFFKRKKWL